MSPSSQTEELPNDILEKITLETGELDLDIVTSCRAIFSTFLRADIPKRLMVNAEDVVPTR